MKAVFVCTLLDDNANAFPPVMAIYSLIFSAMYDGMDLREEAASDD